VAYSFVGKSIPRVDALEKTTGKAIYSSDIMLPGMLFARCKRSPYPFARIVHIDAADALKLPGVRAVITPQNITQHPFGEFAADQYPLCPQYAHYHGDEVAAVAAVSSDVAAEALDLIAVEYEEMKPVFDPELAMAPGAPAVQPDIKDIQNNIAYQLDFGRGKGEAGFEDADVILEERFTTQPMHQGYLQTRDCVAVWNAGKLTLYAAMQSPYRMRMAIARSLGIMESDVRIIPCTVGGGFGNNAFRIWPITALLARKTGRPVKLVLTREEDFISGRPLVSEIIYLRMGFKKDGAIVAKKIDIVADTGAYVGSTRGVLSTSASRADNLYRIPHIKTTAKLVYTNNIPRGSLRGYGTQITTFALESMMDMAAEKLGIDPIELRLKNAVQKDETSVHGFIYKSCGLCETLSRIAGPSGWKKDKPPQRASAKKYGIGLASAIHVAGNRNVMPLFEGGAAFVNIDDSGRVQVISGELEIGQGTETVFTQIAAEEVGVAIENVKVFPVDTEISPFAPGTFGDRVTVLGGHAVKLAAADAKTKLIRQAADLIEANPADLDLKLGKFFIKGSPQPVATLAELAPQIVFRRGGLPISGQGNYIVPDFVVKSDPNTQYGNYSIAYTFITQAARVCVDSETGNVEVLDVWSAIDIGKAINPKACQAQVEGGVMMGIGYALSEEYIVKDGKMLNPNCHDYKLPIIAKLPHIHSYFLETPDPNTPYGAKSIGEAIGDPTAGAIANAVYNAVGARFKDLPITPEKVLAALNRLK